MEEAKTALTELQFTILNGLADDYEDVERLYLYANRQRQEERRLDVQFPNMLLHVRFPLRELVDEIGNMLREGYIEVRYSNDVQVAPLLPPELSLLHHYWFAVTRKGQQAREARSAC